MSVFLAWSGSQSQTVAAALYDWLPKALPRVKCWLSIEDLTKGKDWYGEIDRGLADAKACIICLTPENIRSPWLYWESSAIASRIAEGVLVCPYLVNVPTSMIADGPLSRFQATVADCDDTSRLLVSLNESTLDRPHNADWLRDHVRSEWPVLDAILRPILDAEPDDEDGFIETDADRLAGFQLSPEARTMTVETAKDSRGNLLFSRTSSGTGFQTNGVNLCPDKTARTIARWRSALDTLDDNGILEDRGGEGQVFSLTALGFDIADALNGQRVSPKPCPRTHSQHVLDASHPLGPMGGRRA